SELLPFDFRKAVQAARRAISSYSGPSAETLGLDQTLHLLDTLEAELAEFYSELQGDPPVPAAVASSTPLKLARYPVPFRYHESSILEHDWGGERVPVPGLGQVRNLQERDPSGSEYLALGTRLKRVLNSIEHDIIRAIDLVREA